MGQTSGVKSTSREQVSGQKTNPAAPVSPVLSLSVGVLAASTASIFIRYAQAGAPSLVIAAYRLSIATVILAPFIWLRHRQELLALGKRDFNLALLSGVFLALHFATWITSLEHTTVASSVALVSTVPIWVALLSPFTLKESLSRSLAAGMALALVGGLLIAMSDACTWSQARLLCPSLGELARGQALLGDLLALAGAIMAAGYLLVGRRVRARVSLASYIFLVYGVAAVVLVGLVAAARQPLVGYPPQTAIWFLLLALFPQLVGHSATNWALRYLSAAYVSIAMLGEPIGSTILAAILLHETPSSLKVIGAILILVGIVFASQTERRQALARNA